MVLIFMLPRVLFIFKFCTFPVFLKCSGFFGGMFLVFLGVFLVFIGCSRFSWECPGFLEGVPVFGVFRDVPGCSGVPCSGVLVFLEAQHAEQTVTKQGDQCSEFLVLSGIGNSSSGLRIVSVEERKPGAQSHMAESMADNFVPSWPIILNKSLEERDLHRLLGQRHKVRGK